MSCFPLLVSIFCERISYIRVFPVHWIIPTNLLNASQARKLIFAVCVQTLSRKDGKALSNV